MGPRTDDHANLTFSAEYVIYFYHRLPHPDKPEKWAKIKNNLTCEVRIKSTEYRYRLLGD
jgi:hypothetical protein